MLPSYTIMGCSDAIVCIIFHICRHASTSNALNMQQSAVDLWQARSSKVQTGMPQDTCLPLHPRVGGEKRMQSVASQARCAVLQGTACLLI